MKVLNLQCGQLHGFEGWFGSEDDYQSQRARGLVSCPLCGDAQITKLLSAPRLNLGAAEPVASQTATAGQVGAVGQVGHKPASDAVNNAAALMPDAASPALQQLQAALLHAVHQVLAHTEDVGTQFADEARKIHYGEAAERGIRGQVTREETEALLDEGIDVIALPLPESLKGPLQ